MVGSTEHPDERLLIYLRQRLQRPAVAYLQSPVRIAGGFDTHIYVLQLACVPPAFSGRLIARIFRDPDGSARATAEGALQNALADAGYLVPRVVDVCTDAAILGGAFTLMHCVAGQTLLAAMARPTMLWRTPQLLARAHARLHAIDPLPIIRAVEGAGVPSSLARTEDVLVRLRAQAQGRGLEGLLPGLEWLEAHRPPAIGRASLLHRDFHPLNVLVANGSVTGVIDWANVGLGEPAADVAATRVVLTMGPLAAPPSCAAPWKRYAAGSPGATPERTAVSPRSPRRASDTMKPCGVTSRCCAWRSGGWPCTPARRWLARPTPGARPSRYQR